MLPLEALHFLIFSPHRAFSHKSDFHAPIFRNAASWGIGTVASDTNSSRISAISAISSPGFGRLRILGRRCHCDDACTRAATRKSRLAEPRSLDSPSSQTYSYAGRRVQRSVPGGGDRGPGVEESGFRSGGWEKSASGSEGSRRVPDVPSRRKYARPGSSLPGVRRCSSRSGAVSNSERMCSFSRCCFSRSFRT